MTEKGRTGAAPAGLGSLSKGQPVPPSRSSKAAPRKGDVPYSIEAEMSVLSGMLLDAEQAWAVGVDHILTAEDFTLEEHQAIYRAILALKGWQVTAVTVATQLAAMGFIDDVDRWLGAPWTEPYLAQLMGDYMAPLWLETHAKIVKEYAERRQMLQHAQRLAKAAYSPRETWKDLPEYRDEA
jgi:replicative DNA helicase